MTPSVHSCNELCDALETIGGDRRAERRYDLELAVRWTVRYRRRALESGTGRTRDLSAHGMMIETGRALQPGSQIEVVVSWPALLHGVCPLSLVAAGRVVRSDGTCTAIRMTQHEFRTTGISAQRAIPPDGAVASALVRNARGPADAKPQ
jgi:hypothetical protein